MEMERASTRARNEPPAPKESLQHWGRLNQALAGLFRLKAPSHTPTLGATLHDFGAQHNGRVLPRREISQDTDDTERIERAVENERDATGRAVGPASTCEAVESPPSTAGTGIFSNMDASVGRSVLSTISERSSVEHISPATNVYEVQKGIFVAPKSGIRGEDLENWSVIRPRLDDTLRHLFKTVKGLDPAMSLEFMLAGPSKSQLRPSIIIVCCSSAYLKQLKKILRSQKWIGGYGYPCMVLVDPLKKLAGPEQELLGPSWMVGETMLPDRNARRGRLRSAGVVSIGILVVTLLGTTLILVLLRNNVVSGDETMGTSRIRAVRSETISSGFITSILAGFLSALLLIAMVVVYRICNPNGTMSFRWLKNYGAIQGGNHSRIATIGYERIQRQESGSSHRSIGPSFSPQPNWPGNYPHYSGGESASAVSNMQGNSSIVEDDPDSWEYELEPLYLTRPAQREPLYLTRPAQRLEVEVRKTEIRESPKFMRRIDRDNLAGIDPIELNERSGPLKAPHLWPSVRTNTDLETHNRVDIYARVRFQGSSICGILVEAAVHSTKKVSFTFGGVIIVGSRHYGLTTRHSFEHGSEQWVEFSDSRASLSSDLEEADDEDDSPYISFDSDSNSDIIIRSPQLPPLTPSLPSLSENSRMTMETLDEELPGDSPQVGSFDMDSSLGGREHIGVLSELGLRYTDISTGQEKLSLDWALIELDNAAGLRFNVIPPVPGNTSRATVSSIMKSNLMEDSQVLILAGVSGPTMGWLRGCPLQMYFQGSSFEARQIVLDGPLGKSKHQYHCMIRANTVCSSGRLWFLGRPGGAALRPCRCQPRSPSSGVHAAN
jgi:hypothetical protein